jgi:hypothetical protein
VDGLVSFVGPVVVNQRSRDGGGVSGADRDALPVRGLLSVGRPDEGSTVGQGVLAVEAQIWITSGCWWSWRQRMACWCSSVKSQTSHEVMCWR